MSDNIYVNPELPGMLVHFKKQVAADVLDAIQDGTPIPPAENGWSATHMLEVAGVLLWAAGTHPHPISGESATMLELLLGASFHAQLAEQVHDATYDVDYDDEVAAYVERDGETDRVQFALGRKAET